WRWGVVTRVMVVEVAVDFKNRRHRPPLSSGPMKPLDLAPDARVVFLTGAGVSVASGLRPYRGPGGLWNEVDVERWATASAMARDPRECWRAHREFARLVAAAAPNPA